MRSEQPQRGAAGVGVQQRIMDADSDVAALVYHPWDNPDAVLGAFAADLHHHGYDVIGTVQRRGFRQGISVSVGELELISEGRRISLGRYEAVRPAYRLDSDGVLEQVAAALAGDLRRQPDLVVLNRFGSAEVRGRGLVDIFSKAVRLDVPALTAVPAALFPAWLAFSGGLAVRTECNRKGLDRWWRSLERQPRHAARSCRWH